MKLLIAIDPGLSGGIAWKHSEGKPTAIKMPPSESEIHEILESEIRNYQFRSDIPVTAYIEDVPTSMGGNKGAASVKLNANAGFLRGVLMSLGARMVMVRPAKWQQHFSLGKRKDCQSDTEWKNKLKNRAAQLYPGLKVTLDTADALLLLEYARVQP